MISAQNVARLTMNFKMKNVMTKLGELNS